MSMSEHGPAVFIDLSDLPLKSISELPYSSLRGVLTRILEERGVAMAGFQNSIEVAP
ncbi:hypothetical protein Acor_14130 [Acrocarpospora corrugata]|uniref:FXSXX-COOH protein n=2 Tax=Acrocarpospora corrugata TaxID=35763 RepID=A0A5M3VTX0_9ACTN|nr:hypothetical protein Acor_14130 [Acrocarpospora corrugata]